jgi:hypothetical protein
MRGSVETEVSHTDTRDGLVFNDTSSADIASWTGLDTHETKIIFASERGFSHAFANYKSAAYYVSTKMILQKQ